MNRISGSTARVREPSQPDAGDAALRAFGDLLRGEPQDLEDHSHVFRDRHPRVQRETLEYDRDPGIQTVQRLAVVEHLTMRRGDEPREHPQDRRFTAAGRSQQRNDFACADRHADMLQHSQLLAVRQGEVLRDVACLA